MGTTLLLAGLLMAPQDMLSEDSGMQVTKVRSFYSFTVNDIDGKPFRFDQLRGKVVMLVNTASRCGLTPQYADLQKVYQIHKDRGLVILGFPANDFNNQEPGTNKEIKEFCQTNFGVTFPMMAKISVLGDAKHPLYRWLVEQSDRSEVEIEWNFAKFLVDRRGGVRFRFTPREVPTGAPMTRAIERLLAEK